MEVFGVLGVWEPLGAEFFDVSTNASFVMCVVLGGASFDEMTGVDGEADAGDIAGLVGGEEQHGVGDVHRLEPGDGKRVEGLEYRCDLLTGDVTAVVGQQVAVHRLVVDHVGVDRAWVHCVDPDHVGCELVGQRLHQPDEAVLGRRIVARGSVIP